MRPPSSSSLLLPSLAVSASSSSSLSALAAPTGDLPEDSSSPTPVAHCRDGAMTRSHGAPIGSTSAFFSDIATDQPQSRGLGEIIPPVVKQLKDDITLLAGMLSARDSASAAAGDENGPRSPTAQPPAPPSTPAMPAKAPVNPPVSPPAQPPKLPLPLPVPIGRRGSIGGLGNTSGRALSPTRRDPPNTPAQSRVAEGLPLGFPGLPVP